MTTIVEQTSKKNICQAKKNCNGWLLITPTEYVEDELMACISSDESSMEYNIAMTYTSLMIRSKSEARCYDQRQLANTETEYIHNKLIWESSVQTWIHNARNFSLYEIMNEIIGMDDSIYRLHCKGIVSKTQVSVS